MIKQNIQNTLNRQLNAEMYSAYLYLSMSSYFESLNLKGFATWMRVQAQEEMTHAMKFYDYVNQRGGRVTLTTIDAPPNEWNSPLAVFEHTYQHEQRVTGLINDLVDLATSDKDHATCNFLQWFVTEQVEEESSADEILQKMKLIGDNKSGLFMLDQELGQRIFKPPASAEENKK